MGEIPVMPSPGKTRVRLAVMSVLGLLLIFFLAQNVVYRESQSVPLPLFEVLKSPQHDIELPDSNISRDIYLNLRAAIAVDNETMEVLYCYNAGEPRPIASLSKLITAMVVLDNYHPDSVMTITKEDARRSSRSILRRGDRVRVRDLLHAALLVSDNRAARALARSVRESREEFARLMNQKLWFLGLEQSEMFEPTGLDERNRSSAADCARLINIAMDYPEIARITTLKKYMFRPLNRKRPLRLVNTNKMVFSKYRVLAGKTGYIIASDYCLATILENKDGHRSTIVVLGSPTPGTRFREARRLANYAFRKIEKTRISGL